MTMRKIFFVGLVALGAVACGGNSNNGTTSSGGQDMAMSSNPDMTPACVSGTPMTNSDFLNACTNADSVDIVPFYPTNAPNGTLPPLQ
jgi:hypothetical protein